MIRYLLAIVLMALVAFPAGAHQHKLVVSTIAINERSQRMEVMHQIPVHDAEHALRRGGTHSPDIVGSEESRRTFASYVADRFRLTVNGDPIELVLVGSEITGGSLWVYQEAPAPAADAIVSVNSQILTDIWSRQENHVNLGGGTDVTTLVFRGGAGFKVAELKR